MILEGFRASFWKAKRGQEGLESKTKKVWKIEGAPGARDFENVPGRVCPTIRGRLLGKPIRAFICHAILSLVASGRAQGRQWWPWGGQGGAKGC